MHYCESVSRTRRFPTREIQIGTVKVGGNQPIRIQSMTTSNTRDVAATIEQTMRLADVGCEIVRFTVQGMKEAEACEQIKNGLLQKGYLVPIVADIHFYPPAALTVAEFVDKVRINPGNFADKRAIFKTIEYDDASYQAELDKIEQVFSPLVQKCKKLGRAMRIGTNHGSLSDRIMNRYGDTPRGMVESALEYAHVCRKLDYHNFLFSMKASNPLVMIQAYRLLVAEMIKLGWDDPLHLGVTEAGEGEDGRVKSSIGIASLLLDGLGDTIRVSLTEDPWHEIDPCKRLIRFFESSVDKGIDDFQENHRHIQEITKRNVLLASHAHLHRDGSVLLPLQAHHLGEADLYTKLGCEIQLGRPIKKGGTVDAVLIEEVPEEKNARAVLQTLQQAGIGVITRSRHIPGALLLCSLDHLPSDAGSAELAVLVEGGGPTFWERLCDIRPSMILFSASKSRLHEGRRFFDWVKEQELDVPVILYFDYACNQEDLIIHAAAELGALLADGLGEGILLSAPYSLEVLKDLSFNILQGARMRASKTEFISCPGCGRTLFDLQEVSRRIRARTGHLPGVKVAIMGCIVNGPGEMADADFGYVGSKPGKIDLYVGKQCVERNIEFDEADQKLVDLIKAHGRWKEVEHVESQI